MLGPSLVSCRFLVVSLSLSGAAFFILTAVGMVLGMIAALREGSGSGLAQVALIGGFALAPVFFARDLLRNLSDPDHPSARQTFLGFVIFLLALPAFLAWVEGDYTPLSVWLGVACGVALDATAVAVLRLALARSSGGFETYVWAQFAAFFGLCVTIGLPALGAWALRGQSDDFVILSLAVIISFAASLLSVACCLVLSLLSFLAIVSLVPLPAVARTVYPIQRYGLLRRKMPLLFVAVGGLVWSLGLGDRQSIQAMIELGAALLK